MNFFFPGKFYSHREVTLWLDFAKAVGRRKRPSKKRKTYEEIQFERKVNNILFYLPS